MEKYMAFVIQAYNSMLGDGRLDDVTTITLMDESAENAMARAKKLIKKKSYRVSDILENYVKS